MKPYHQRSVFADPDFSEKSTKCSWVLSYQCQIREGSFPRLHWPRKVERIVDQNCARGRSSPFNVQFLFRFRGEGPNSDGWYHRREIPHCSEFIRSYFASIQDVSPDPQLLTTRAPPV